MPSLAICAPGRVNLIGDHTDYTGGFVLPMAIDRWTRIEGRVVPGRVQLRSADEPSAVGFDLPLAVDAGSVDPSWGRYVAAVVAELDEPQGIDADVSTTIPVGAGLSSSAALEVAVALALGYDGEGLDLAQRCRRAEHRATGVPTGIMDQLCIATAVDGHALLIDCRSTTSTPVPVPDDVQIVVRFVAHRTLEGSGYGERVAECEAAERVIGPLRDATVGELHQIDDPTIRSRARHVITENRRVLLAVDALRAGDHAEVGRLMSASHASLRDNFAVSTPAMDAAVAALESTPGVHGARMTGGGFGGCVVAWCEPGTPIDGWVVRPVGAAGPC